MRYGYISAFKDFKSLEFSNDDFLEIDGIREYFSHSIKIADRSTLPYILQSLQLKYMGETEFYKDTNLLVLSSKQECKIKDASKTIKRIIDIDKLPVISLRNHIIV